MRVRECVCVCACAVNRHEKADTVYRCIMKAGAQCLGQ